MTFAVDWGLNTTCLLTHSRWGFGDFVAPLKKRRKKKRRKKKRGGGGGGGGGRGRRENDRSRRRTTRSGGWGRRRRRRRREQMRCILQPMNTIIQSSFVWVRGQNGGGGGGGGAQRGNTKIAPAASTFEPYITGFNDEGTTCQKTVAASRRGLSNTLVKIFRGQPLVNMSHPSSCVLLARENLPLQPWVFTPSFARRYVMRLRDQSLRFRMSKTWRTAYVSVVTSC